MDKEILLLTCAFRYALGRNTGASPDVMEKYYEIKGRFKTWQLESWIKDVKYQIGLQEHNNDYFSKGIVDDLNVVLKVLEKDLKNKEGE